MANCLLHTICQLGTKDICLRDVKVCVPREWEILKTVWLMDEAIGNTTETELKDVIRHRSNVIVVRSRLGYEDQFFEVIQKLGVSKHKTV